MYKTLVVTLFVSVAFKHHVTLFASTTFEHHVALFSFVTFGHTNCGWLHSEFSKLEKKKDDNETNKRRSKKYWCHEVKGITREEITRRQTKLWLKINYLKIICKETINIIRKKRCFVTGLVTQFLNYKGHNLQFIHHEC